MKLLILSNGHGEDQIAIRIVEQLQSITRQSLTDELKLAALPIVGEGYVYQKLNIPIIGKVQQMPSGGFIYLGGNPLWQDLKGGLIQLTIEQIKVVRQWGKNGGYILAVGDIVPLLYAWLGGGKYAFVGTAKSEYYLRDDRSWLSQTSWLERQLGSVYLPWERWLMSCDRSVAVFPRDSLTTKILQQWSIPAYDLGNPMMDGLAVNHNSLTKKGNFLSVLLLPGSRMPESLNNWQQILDAVTNIIRNLSKKRSLEFSAAIAPALNSQAFQEELIDRGWKISFSESQPLNDPQLVTFIKENATLNLTQNAYGECLQRAVIAIAMTGTATEQAVGVGMPVITMPGKGPQFTPAFAEAQTRLLGCSVILVENARQVSSAIALLLDNPQQLEQIAINGKQRMGSSGAAKRIALCLQDQLLR
ncbi:MAG: lipid-A-disaccharide synthase-related protein [Pleurocapsa sp.]